MRWNLPSVPLVRAVICDHTVRAGCAAGGSHRGLALPAKPPYFGPRQATSGACEHEGRRPVPVCSAAHQRASSTGDACCQSPDASDGMPRGAPLRFVFGTTFPATGLSRLWQARLSLPIVATLVTVPIGAGGQPDLAMKDDIEVGTVREPDSTANLGDARVPAQCP